MNDMYLFIVKEHDFDKLEKFIMNFDSLNKFIKIKNRYMEINIELVCNTS